MSDHSRHPATNNAYEHRTFDPSASVSVASYSPIEPAICWPLWEARQAYFYQRCLGWLHGNQADADDAFNTAALAVWRATQEQTRAIVNPMGWLTGIVQHVCLDLHCKRQREASHTVAMDAIDCETGVASLASSPSCRSPEIIFLQREECTYVHQAIHALPLRLCTPLLLRFYQGLTYEEIAAQLQLSPEAVRKQIQEARTLLARQRRQYLTDQVGLIRATSWSDEDGRLTATPLTNPDVDNIEALLKPRVAYLSRVSKREAQKLRTLRAYVVAYPNGWKKRLALADQLCKLGEQAEAVVIYEQVLAKQPQLLSVWLQVGRLYTALKQDVQAVAAYERALPLAATATTRDAIIELIENVTAVDDE